MVRHAGNGPDALTCRHDDHWGTTHVLDFPTHSSGAATKASEESGDKEEADCVSVPFTQEVEHQVEFNRKSSEDVFF